MASLNNVDRLRARTGVSYEDAREALDSSGDDLLDALIWLENKGLAEPPGAAHSGAGTARHNAGATRYGDDAARYGAGDTEADGGEAATGSKYYDSTGPRAERRESRESRDSRENRKSRAYSAYSGAGYGGGGDQSAKYHDRAKKSEKRRERDEKRSRASSRGDRHEFRSGLSSFLRAFGRFVGKAFQVGNTSLLEVRRYDREILKLPLTLLVIAFILFFQVVLILLPVGLFFGMRYRLTGEHFKDSPLNSVMDAAADAVDGLKEAFTKNKNA